MNEDIREPAAQAADPQAPVGFMQRHGSLVLGLVAFIGLVLLLVLNMER